MTRIDFYLLKAHEPQLRQRYACRIAEKAYALGHRVHIHTDSPQASRQLDELLWTFNPGSFVPHEVEPERPEDCPVTIGHAIEGRLAEPPAPHAVLVNLAADVPVSFSRFERVAEILDEDPAVLDEGRNRYRFYRDRGYELNHHEIAPR